MDAIDIHAHYVSPALIDEARRAGEDYGVEVLSEPEGDVLVFRHNGVRIRPIFSELRDLPARRRYMSDRGVAMQVVSTWTDIVGDDLPLHQSVRWVRLQNETLVSDVREAGEGFSPMGALPMQDADAAIAELRHLVDTLGVRAVEIVTSVNGRDLDRPEYRPLWQELESLEVFVLLHPPLCPVGQERSDDFFLNNLVFFPADTTVAAAKLIFSGVMDDHPGLHVCLAHGGGFLPYQVGRLDKGFQVHPACQRVLTELPSQYLDRFYYDTLTHDDAALSYLVSRVGAERIMFGSDYPFEMTDDFGASRVLNLPGISTEQAEAILSGNALPVFDPPVRAGS